MLKPAKRNRSNSKINVRAKAFDFEPEPKEFDAAKNTAETEPKIETSFKWCKVVKKNSKVNRQNPSSAAFGIRKDNVKQETTTITISYDFAGTLEWD